MKESKWVHHGIVKGRKVGQDATDQLEWEAVALKPDGYMHVCR